MPLTSQSSLITPSERGASFETTLVDLRSPSLREYQRDPRGRDREFCPVAASVRWNISFPAPRPFHPSACKRRHGITDQSSIRPSSTAAAASPQSSAAFSSKRSSENHPSPKPAPRQIPIDGQAPTAFPCVRSSEAFRRIACRPEADPLDVVRLPSAGRSRTILDGPVLRHQLYRYGISSIDEARAYLAHPVLGPRLDLCTGIVLASESPSLHAIFGSPDDLKFRSCMTLFSLAADGPDNPFRRALDRWCGGQPDEQTLALIDAGG